MSAQTYRRCRIRAVQREGEVGNPSTSGFVDKVNAVLAAFD